MEVTVIPFVSQNDRERSKKRLRESYNYLLQFTDRD
eukprot:CAMPEP_0185759206 /NCGR_PEP_ID=MMETSP1174-20130828/17922_1 /TAXON_ID=35687 /ORGANISM="Dictyocha speculum, Strain CCMP1381" /LENGTH=35 /DNA_ID= /DNA_START= /DNA_END= /DNA_ORIENTATION=